jgi:small subunit ribosomal protein S17
MVRTMNIGLETQPPKQSCDDENCPYHGSLRVRGRILTGIVVSDKMRKTVTVEREYLHYVKKYMRYEKRRSRILAHNPPCISAESGDTVKIAECKPIAKNVAFVVVEKRREA